MSNDFDKLPLLLNLNRLLFNRVAFTYKFPNITLVHPFSATTTTFNNWDAGDPNNGGPLQNEDCALIKPDGKWNDYPCKDRFNYICKRKPREYNFLFIFSSCSYFKCSCKK